MAEEQDPRDDRAGGGVGARGGGRVIHARGEAMTEEQKRLLALQDRELYEAEHDRDGWHRLYRQSQQEVHALRAERDTLKKTLQSIADNSCCAPCREAGLFARAALADSGG